MATSSVNSDRGIHIVWGDTNHGCCRSSNIIDQHSIFPPNRSMTRSSGLLLVLCATALTQTGCASLNLMSTSDSDVSLEAALKQSPEAMLYRAVETAGQSNAVVLQVKGAEKPFRIIPLPSGEQHVFMNDLLRQAGLLKRVNSLNVSLYRSDGQIMDSVRMKVTFDKRNKRVSTGTDYALRPGDRITVSRDHGASVIGFFDGLVPPVAQNMLR